MIWHLYETRLWLIWLRAFHKKIWSLFDISKILKVSVLKNWDIYSKRNNSFVWYCCLWVMVERFLSLRIAQTFGQGSLIRVFAVYTCFIIHTFEYKHKQMQNGQIIHWWDSNWHTKSVFGTWTRKIPQIFIWNIPFTDPWKIALYCRDMLSMYLLGRASDRFSSETYYSQTHEKQHYIAECVINVLAG